MLKKDLIERENAISYMKEAIKGKYVKKKSFLSVSVQIEECSSSRNPSFHTDEHHNCSQTAKSVHADESSLASKFVHTTKTFGTVKTFQVVKNTCHNVKTPAPSETPNIRRAQSDKFNDVCSCFNNASYMDNQSKERKKRP